MTDEGAAAARAEARPGADGQTLTHRLLEREEMYRAVLDGVELGIVMTGRSGMITFVNRTAKELLRQALPMGDVRDLLGLQSTPEELVRGAPKLSYVLPLCDGEAIDVELSAFRAEGPWGEPNYFFLFRDMREENTRSADRERLERLAAIGTMVAGFAHEVRNPVAALRSLAESLADDLADAQIDLPHVSRMLQVLERMERLVRTSLQFGRPAAPRRAHHRPWTIVSNALGEVGARVRPLGGEIRIEVEPDLPDVYVDDAQLIQVLVILLNNALDAVGLPARVLVRATLAPADAGERRRDDSLPVRPRVRFEVCDDGPGIPPEIVGRIFDPFFTTKASGTGLGLSIAQHIVSENGSSIDVTSARGGPTTFRILVPTRIVP
jgi:two-component system sensor histidine kinase HydH